MFSGSSRHSGTRVYWLFSTLSMIVCGGSSAHTVSILVRWTMMSSTCSSRRSSTPPSMFASPRATAPSLAPRPMVPRISSCAARMLAASSAFDGVIRRILRTMKRIAMVTGASSQMTACISGATASAMRSG